MTVSLPEEAVTLLERGRREGCVTISEVDAAAAELNLDDDQLGELYRELDENDVEVSDDCGRETDEFTYANGELAACSSSSTRSVAIRSSPPPRRSSWRNGSSAATRQPKSR